MFCEAQTCYTTTALQVPLLWWERRLCQMIDKHTEERMTLDLFLTLAISILFGICLYLLF